MTTDITRRLNNLSFILEELEDEIGKTLNEIRKSKSGGSQGSTVTFTGPWSYGKGTIIGPFTTANNKTEDPLKAKTGQSILDYLESIGADEGDDDSYHCEVCDTKHWDADCDDDFEDYIPTWKDKALTLYDDLFGILVSKQNDYGPDNIRLAPGGALNGLRVRLYDKIARLNNLIGTGVTPENESLRDTLIDIANYGVIGIMILDDTFPKSKDA